MAAGILVLGAVLGGLAWRWEGRASTAAAIRDASGVRWIIDAGHGGEDGGAVSPGGVVESRINLEIARRVDGIFGFCGERRRPTCTTGPVRRRHTRRPPC